MSVSVPLIGDPRNMFLGALPFAHARARDQCHSAIRRVVDATAEQEHVQIMLNLATLNGPTLLAMVANVVRTDSSVLVVLTGREVDSDLAGLLYNSELVADGGADFRVRLDRDSSETDVSSITLSLGLLSIVQTDVSSITLSSGLLPIVQTDVSSSTLSSKLPSIFRERSGRDQLESSNPATATEVEAAVAAVAHQLGVPPERFVTFTEVYKAAGARDAAASWQRLLSLVGETAPLPRAAGGERVDGTAAPLDRDGPQGADTRHQRSVTRWSKNARILAMWLLVEHRRLDFGVVSLIGEYCWEDGWR